MKKIVCVLWTVLCLCAVISVSSCAQNPDVTGGDVTGGTGSVSTKDPFAGTSWYYNLGGSTRMKMLEFKGGKYNFGTAPSCVTDTYTVRKSGSGYIAICKVDTDEGDYYFEVSSASATTGDFGMMVGSTKSRMYILEKE